MRCLVGAGRDLHADSGPAAADVVERRDRLGEVKRLGVRDDGSGNQADVTGQRSHSVRHQHRVQPAAHTIGPRLGAGPVAGLQTERVLDGDDVEQPGFCLADQIRPVTGREQLIRTGRRLAPRGRVPAGAVQRHSQMERIARHVWLLDVDAALPMLQGNSLVHYSAR